MMMFCSDDKHPDSLVEGHINRLCSRAIAHGVGLFTVLKAACVNPVNHYKLKVGLLRQNDFADFIVVRDLSTFRVLRTYIDGSLVAEEGKTRIDSQPVTSINHFSCSEKKPVDFAFDQLSREGLVFVNEQTNDTDEPLRYPVIEALDGQLITNKAWLSLGKNQGHIHTDTEKDILKIVVVNRYKDAPVAKALIRNFGLKKGALASSVAHDSHNIVAVGVDDESLAAAVNLVIQHKGGISCFGGGKAIVLPLPVAGLMSSEDGYLVAEKYAAIDAAAKALGATLSAPFMTLSFMALLVIPHLKLSDLGLFDGDSFRLIR